MENIFKLFDGWPLKTQKMAQKAENRYYLATWKLGSGLVYSQKNFEKPITYSEF